MRLLFINQYYAPDYAATAQQLSDLCEALAARGHEVHVLTSRAIYDGRKLDVPEEEILNGVHVHRVGIASTGRARIRERLVGYASFYLKAFIKANTLPTPDVVVTLTTPPMISLLGGWLRLFRGSRFVYWVMDIYPDIALEAGVLSRIGPIRAAWSALGRLSYAAANRIVVLGDDMRRAIARKTTDPRKIRVIQSWSCRNEVYPVPPVENEFRAKTLKASAKDFVLMYSGNMGTCHAFKGVIAGVKALGVDINARFAFVGGGKQQPMLKEALGTNPLVQFLPYQDRADLALSLSAPDAHLITLQPQYDGLLLPSKLYGAMAAGRAILFAGSTGNDVARTVERAECGIVVPPNDGEAFAEAVRWMAANPEKVAEMGARGRRYFEEHFDKEIALQRFAELFESLDDKPRHARASRRVAVRAVAPKASRSEAEVLEVAAAKD